MSSDGAERALKTILGGDPEPGETERRSPVAMRRKIMAVTEVTDYDSAASMAAKMILEYLEADPATRLRIPTENVYKKDEEGRLVSKDGGPVIHVGDMVLVEKGLYDCMKADGVPIDDLGLSGFQWGWACNSARYCMDLPPEPNPAIIEIG